VLQASADPSLPQRSLQRDQVRQEGWRGADRAFARGTHAAHPRHQRARRRQRRAPVARGPGLTGIYVIYIYMIYIYIYIYIYDIYNIYIYKEHTLRIRVINEPGVANEELLLLEDPDSQVYM